MHASVKELGRGTGNRGEGKLSFPSVSVSAGCNFCQWWKSESLSQVSVPASSSKSYAQLYFLKCNFQKLKTTASFVNESATSLSVLQKFLLLLGGGKKKEETLNCSKPFESFLSFFPFFFFPLPDSSEICFQWSYKQRKRVKLCLCIGRRPFHPLQCKKKKLLGAFLFLIGYKVMCRESEY